MSGDNMMQVARGIWKITLGTPERDTPVSHRQSPICTRILDSMSSETNIPLDIGAMKWRKTKRGFLVEIPYDRSERIYGGGLQLKSLRQDGKKRTLRTNADPVADTGDSHAPVPFYVSSKGYGVFVDTARYAVFCFGGSMEKGELPKLLEEFSNQVHTDVESLYSSPAQGNRICIEIPVASGVDLYFFSGPAMRDVVRRYVAFSGGGTIPPLWGLAPWYRVCAQFDQEQVLKMEERIREAELPISVIGLEPGWHSNCYPNSYVWSRRFPEPETLIRRSSEQGFRLNLWENAFVHPTACPFAREILPWTGDEPAMRGYVPDFLTREACRIFGDYHEKELLDNGIAGFKLDECDSGDYYSGGVWAFPDYAEFPSGVDGEQMHSFIGIKYQEMFEGIFRRRNQRHFDLVRASHALASPMPFVLYSDLYAHGDFIRGMVTAGFSGLLWSPEVREGRTSEDLIRRIQAVMLAPCALINGWYMNNFPWLCRGVNELLAEEEGRRMERYVRDAMKLRIQLLPYVYTAFAVYHNEGIPPFRALAMDWPDDEIAGNCDDEFMIGDAILAAPFVSGAPERRVYLPEGAWMGFSDKREYAGPVTFLADNDLANIPLFVKKGAVIPLASPVPFIRDGEPLPVHGESFGEECAGILYDDDGLTYDYLKEPGAFVGLRTENGVVRFERTDLRLWSIQQGSSGQ